MCAIGRIGPAGDWVGLRRTASDDYELIFGSDDGTIRAPVRASHRADLTAAAIAYFEESFDDPPADLEATQHDIGDLVRWLAQTERDEAVRLLLSESVDGIDDGLAADVLIGRLGAALAVLDPGDQTDPAARLVWCHRSGADG